MVRTWDGKEGGVEGGEEYMEIVEGEGLRSLMCDAFCVECLHECV